MPDNLTDYEETRLLDLSIQSTDYVALMSTLGTDASIGVEVTGGGYGRVGAVFGAAANGTKTSNGPHLYINMPTIDIQGWAIMSAASSGNRKWYGLFNPRTASAQASADTITATAHGLANGAKVVFQSGFAPAGLSPNTTYYVISATTNTFQLATAPGGTAVDITADGSGLSVGDVITVNAGEVLAIPSGSLVLSLS